MNLPHKRGACSSPSIHEPTSTNVALEHRDSRSWAASRATTRRDRLLFKLYICLGTTDNCSLFAWIIFPPQVFFKISIDLLLDGCEPGSDEDDTVGDRPLSSRLHDPGCVEARCVASRLLERTSAEGFTDGIRRLDGNKVGRGRRAISRGLRRAESARIRPVRCEYAVACSAPVRMWNISFFSQTYEGAVITIPCNLLR